MHKVPLLCALAVGAFTPFLDLAGSVYGFVQPHPPDAAHPENHSLTRYDRQPHVPAQLYATVPDIIIRKPDMRSLLQTSPMSGDEVIEPINFPHLLPVSAGWSEGERWGTWSDGNEARLILPVFPNAYPDGVTVTLKTRGWCPGSHVQTVNVKSRGHILSVWTYTPASFDRQYTLTFDKAFLDKKEGLVLDFTIPTAASPLSLGYSTRDTRRLGFAIIRITVVANGR